MKDHPRMNVDHKDSPFGELEEARIHTIAELVAMRIMEEFASRGGGSLKASEIIEAMSVRDMAMERLEAFPHRKD